MTPEEKRDKALAFIRERKASYLETFGAAGASAAMLDLAAFCRAGATTFHPDSHVHALIEGRREAWLRIQDHLTLTDEELLRRYGGEK